MGIGSGSRLSEPGPASVSNYFDINNEYVATLCLLMHFAEGGLSLAYIFVEVVVKYLLFS